ncbi:MAG: hypothetical protein HOD92_16525 [Deltaproteobacteria bacterium]|jgi:hypothetical protein|nr:hypothetical protein [Deltaproteobacteria bacterium]
MEDIIKKIMENRVSLLCDNETTKNHDIFQQKNIKADGKATTRKPIKKIGTKFFR